MNLIKLIILAGLTMALPISSAFSDVLGENLTVREVRPDLFIVTHSYPWPANSLAAVMENGEILLVDTPYTPQAMELVLNWIDRKFGKRNIKAVNTHFHVDRLGGNEALVKRNIPVYGSELTPKAIQARGKSSLDWTASKTADESIKQYYLHFEYTVPTKIFDSSKGLTLHFGKETAEVRYFGPGHSIDNLFVFLPEKKTIFGGCAILSMEAKTPGNVSDGSVAEWKKTLELMDTNHYDLVIPGHGGEGGIELIDHTKKILSQF